MAKEEPSNQNKALPPSEEDMEALLSYIKPSPGKRFYTLMEKAPWESRWRRPSLQALRLLAAGGLILIVFLSVTFTIPSVQAAARQLLHFFVPSNSDQRVVQAQFPLPGSEMDVYYALSLDQAQKDAGYPLKTIALLPDKMVFRGAHFEPSLKSVALRYTDGIDNLILTQHPLGNVEEYSSIGASATVEPVQVHGVQGEFVSGAWRLQASQATFQEPSLPGTQANLGLYWDAGLPQHILRWQEGGMAYEIICSGEAIAKAELIKVADSIQ
jgi:hypothetical protein